MGNTSAIFARSFAGGELSPEFALRADLARYNQGLRTCHNFIIRKSGAAANRPGTRYIGPCKTNLANVQLVRFVTPSGDSVLIEAGNGYLRFYQGGGPVTISSVSAWSSGTTYNIGDVVSAGGSNYYSTANTNLNHNPTSQPSAYWGPAMSGGIYEVPTPFTTAGLFDWSQSGQVLTLTARDSSVQPWELIYLAIDDWVIRPVTTAPQVSAPTGLALTIGAAGTQSYGYVVTAAAPVTYEESQASGQVINTATLTPTATAPNKLTWSTVMIDGVASPEYYVYCDPYGNGTYGYIGTATGATSFNDTGITPDFTLTPPVAVNLFDDSGDYPSVSGNYQQRRIFANTPNAPDAVNMSRTGLISNFGISSPLQDDDAVAFRIAGNNNHPVRHLVPLKVGLVILTDGGEWSATGPQGAAIAPNAIDLEQNTYVGADPTVRPAVIGNGIVYLQARGSIMRELRFDIAFEALTGKDVSQFAGHLFEGHTLRALDFQQCPDSIVWGVRDDGVLLGMTYIPGEEMMAWHRHDTLFGEFYDVCVIPETTEDTVYVITARDFGSGTVMSIEALASRTIVDWNADSFFVDMGLSYSGSPVSSVSGLDYLDGQAVAVLADGVVVDDGTGGTVVSGGSVSLPAAASNIHVGLPIQFAELEGMDIDVAGAEVRDRRKRVQAVRVVLYESSRTFQASMSEATAATRFAVRPGESAAVSYSGDVEFNIQASWDDPGRVYIRQTDPLPITVLGFVPQVELGG